MGDVGTTEVDDGERGCWVAFNSAPPVDLATMPTLAHLARVDVPLPDLQPFNRLLAAARVVAAAAGQAGEHAEAAVPIAVRP